MTGARRRAFVIIGLSGALAAVLGGAIAAVHNDFRAGVSSDFRRLETAIASDISLLKTPPQFVSPGGAALDGRIIREARIQLALATLQEVVRDTVESHGGGIASMTGDEPVAQPWGATIRLTARFDAPHASVIDIVHTLETGEPAIRVEEAMFNSRAAPGGSDAAVMMVTAEITVSAFTSAKPTAR